MITHSLFVGGDIGRFRDAKVTGWGDSYRVLLIDDPVHNEDLGVKFNHNQVVFLPL